MPGLSLSPKGSPWPAPGFAHPNHGWEGPCLEEGNAARERTCEAQGKVDAGMTFG